LTGLRGIGRRKTVLGLTSLVGLTVVSSAFATRAFRAYRRTL
jgi:hypothetical protein